MTHAVDPVALAADLIRCPSVTPADAGALGVLERELAAGGFACRRIRRGGIENLFARWGAKAHPQSFGFNGHTDVVPPGDAGAWSFDPFGGEIRDGMLCGRGAADMKSGVAAFAAAAVDFVRETPPDGAILLTVTGDEEGDARDGTRALLDWMAAEGERMAVCLVGEPTCPEALGDMMKIGRRGSMNVRFVARGVQAHSAYPHRGRNPVAAIAALADRLARHRLDAGTAHFDPSTIALTAIDTGNPASNIIPARCTLRANLRFNDLHTGAGLTAWLEGLAAEVASATGVAIETEVSVSGEAFLTPPGPLSDLVAAAVEAETGLRPAFSTSGGTSDARFVKDHCPVVEFGLVGQTMHQIDERVEVAQVRRLTAIYRRILAGYFA
jgi:succinyl-diaminopimelate desuccinylase